MKLIPAIFLLSFLFIQPAFAEMTGNLSSSTGVPVNITIVTGLFGYTVSNCSSNASCFGYTCFLDFDSGTDSGTWNTTWGLCNATSVRSCIHDNRDSIFTRVADSSYYCATNTTYRTCSGGSWSAATSCSSGQTCTVDAISTSVPCAAPSTSSTSSSAGAPAAATVTLSIINMPTEVSIVQGSAGNVTVDVRNNGNSLTNNITLSVSGIAWATITPSIYSTLVAGNSKPFNIAISVPSNAEIKTYTVTLAAASTNATATANFVLKVLPSPSTSIDINQTYLNYISILSELNANLTALEGQGATKSDVDAIKKILASAQTKITQANRSITSNDYFTANSLLADAASLFDEARNKIRAIGFGEPTTPTDMTLIYIIVGVVIAIVAFIIYLFWPTKTQKPFLAFKKTK
jgi:hypothetical protein